jgi:hypothetical protein
MLDNVLGFYRVKSNFDEFVTNNEKKIKSIYDDPSNPIIWIVRYKDSMCNYYKKLKPPKPDKRPIHNILNIYANHVSNIKAHLLKLSKVKFYLIEISIQNMLNIYTEYRKSIVTDWISKERIIDKSGPTCI